MGQKRAGTPVAAASLMISHPVEAQSGFTEPSTSLPSLLPVSVLPDFCVLHPVCSVALFAFLLPVSRCTLIIMSFFFKRKKKLCLWGPAGHPAASTLRFPRHLGCRASLWQDAGGTATPQGSVRVFLVQVSALRCLPSHRIRTAWFGRDLKVHPVPTPSDVEEHRPGLCRAAVTCQTGLGAFLCAAEASSARGPAPKPRGAAYLGAGHTAWAVGLQLRKMPSKACVWWGQSVREGLWVCKHGCCFLCLAWLRRNSRPSAPTPASTRNTKPKLALLLFPAN